MSFQTPNPPSHQQETPFTEADSTAIAEMVEDVVKQEMQAQMQALQEENLELQDRLRRLATFDPTDHLIKIGSGQNAKDYLQVQWRLVWFRLAYPHGSIETELIYHDPDRPTKEEGYAWDPEKRRSEKVTKHQQGYALFKAVVRDGKGGVATGYKSEKAASFLDYLEKAETGSVGRALAAIGFGTQFTGDEFDEQHRIVDSPVDLPPRTKRSGTSRAREMDAASRAANSLEEREEERTREAPQSPTASPQASGEAITAGSGKITEPQRKSLLNLYTQLGEDVPDLSAMTEVEARMNIPQLNSRLREKKQQARPATGIR